MSSQQTTNKYSNVPPPRPPLPQSGFSSRTSSLTHHESHSHARSTLPSYDEVIPENSSLQRRGSTGDMEQKSYSHKMRRSSSFRRKSKKKVRPKITILSSQPMAHHPAFADGSKGSCVPPEAPPSYDDVVNSTVPAHYSVNDGNVCFGNTGTSVCANDNSPLLREINENELNNLLSIDEPLLVEPLLPQVMSSPVGSSNTNQFHGNISGHGTSYSAPIESLDSGANSSALIYSTVRSSSPAPSARKNIPANESASPLKSLAPPLPSRPPIPKRHGAAPSEPSSATNSVNNSPLLKTQSPFLNNHNSLNNDHLIASSTKDSSSFSKQRKLPPPRPAAGPKRTSLHHLAMHKTVDVDSDADYATVMLDSQKVIFTRGSEADHKVMGSNINSSEAALPTKMNDRDKISEKPLTDLPDKILNTTDLEKVEPTYAVVKRPPSYKKKSPVVVSEQTDLISCNDNFHSGVPPPIPENRPPLEDYEGIFSEENDLLTTKNTSKEIKSIASLNTDQRLTSSSTKSFEDYSSIPTNSLGIEEEGEEDPYESVSFNEDSLSVPRTHGASPKQSPSHSHSKENLAFSFISEPSVESEYTSIQDCDQNPNATARVARKASISKSYDVIKRKSSKLKQKSKNLLKFRGSADEQSSSTRNNDSIVTHNSADTSTLSKNRPPSDIPPITKHRYPSNGRTKIKRTPPPRPALPLFLQNKPNNVDATKISSCSPSSVQSSDEVLLISSSAVEKIKPLRPAPLPPPTLSRQLTSTDKSSNTSTQNIPVPKPRTRTNGILNQSEQFSKNVGPPKPIRPPPVHRNTKHTASVGKLLTNDQSSNGDAHMQLSIWKEVHGTAIFDYIPSNSTDLSLSAGEKVFILNEIDDQLVFGKKKNGDEGSFPKKHVTLSLNSNNSNNTKPIPKARHKYANTEFNLCQAKALYDYSSNNSDDLNFVAGTVIDIIETIDNEWFKGRVGEKIGIFPRSFVSILPKQINANSHDKRAVSVPAVTNLTALYDFEGLNEDELSVKTGDKIEFLHRVNKEWIMGRQNGKSGRIPLSFVDSSLMKPCQTNIIVTNRTVETATAIFDFSSNESSELPFKKDDVITITGKIGNEWLRGELRGKSGIFPANFVTFNSY